MPRYRRIKVPGATYFFTVNLYDRKSKLLIEEYDSLITSIMHIKMKYPFQLRGWVILPDHMHCIWTLPPNDADYSGRWREIKKRFTKSCKKRLQNCPKRIWQHRFWEHALRNQTDFEKHLDYIHINPQKHGHVHHVRDWPHSSFHIFVKKGRYNIDWAG